MNTMTELLQIMQTLRDPEHGCPWDKQQTISSISPYTLEEAYELVEAIELKDTDGMRDELGDLLFHIVFYAQMANEAELFCFDDIVRQVNEKLIRRHPHVFANRECAGTEDVQQLWESIKQQERAEKNADTDTKASYLDGISQAQPAVLRAHKLQKRAASVGFDWDNAHAVVAKIEEELLELKQEMNEAKDRDALEAELGDLMFAVINCARHLEIDPEQALRSTNRKFQKRFGYVEDELKNEGRELADATLDEMEALWEEAKAN